MEDLISQLKEARVEALKWKEIATEKCNREVISTKDSRALLFLDFSFFHLFIVQVLT